MSFIGYYGLLIWHYILSKPIDILHSPFVFSLYNACVHPAKRLKVDAVGKTNRLAQRLILHLHAKHGIEFCGSNVINVLLSKNDCTILKAHSWSDVMNFTSQAFDIILIRSSYQEISIPFIQSCYSLMHNNTILLIESPYKNQESRKLWKKVKTQPEVKVTIDLFFVGLISLRKEQVKENFNLRWF